MCVDLKSLISNPEHQARLEHFREYLQEVDRNLGSSEYHYWEKFLDFILECEKLEACQDSEEELKAFTLSLGEFFCNPAKKIPVPGGGCIRDKVEDIMEDLYVPKTQGEVKEIFGAAQSYVWDELVQKYGSFQQKEK